MTKQKSNIVKWSVVGIAGLILTVFIGLYGYGIQRIDKNTEKISDVQKNYVTEDAFNKRMDRVDDTLNRILEKR